MFETAEIELLTAEIDAVFASTAPERSRTDAAEFRYEMLNRSAACQAAVGHPRILEVIEPLLGDDCHVIANTAWRNPPEFPGGPWHCDAGPHVPRPEASSGTIASRIRCSRSARTSTCGTARSPTVRRRSYRAAIARVASHPSTSSTNESLTYDGRPPAVLDGGRRRCRAVRLGRVASRPARGRRLGPATSSRCTTRRRDIAQRIRTTDDVHQLSAEAVARATTDRDKTLVGLHPPFFYDG